jgi:hypothetical protein
MTRTVQWDTRDFSAAAIRALVLFEFSGSYDNTKQFSSGNKLIRSSAEGLGSADLFVNESGNQTSWYTCYIGAEVFSFVVPPGEGSINLSALRDAQFFVLAGDGTPLLTNSYELLTT